MGNCCYQTVAQRMALYNFEYRPKTWDSADVEMNLISNKLGIKYYEKLDERAGPNGFPYKIRGQFAKVILKSANRNGFRAQMNIRRLRSLIKERKTGEDFFCLPDRVEESIYSHIFIFPLMDMDLVDWIKNHFWTSVHRDNIFMKICAAVEFLHNNEFVHRDIKLENICMKNNEPFLIDLDSCSLATMHEFKGTKDYMPPRDVMRHLYSKRDDISMKTKNKYMDCYALAKTFALILCVENERKEEGKSDIIKILWRKWCKEKQSSLRAIQNHNPTLEYVTKWWVLIYNFAYYNEEAVFDSSMDIKGIQMYKNINFN